MVWHYHDDDLAGPAAAVDLRLSGLPGGTSEAGLRHFRVDGVHSNSFSQWKVMGSPMAPNDSQYAVLRQSGALSLLEPPSRVPLASGGVTLRFELPRQGVSLIVLDLGGTGGT
jgi:xylan 1,4-beta-xylosidase